MAEKARAAALRALELDPELSEAHVALALIRLAFEWDWSAAEPSFQRAIELRPSNATAHLTYGIALPAAGRLADGLAELHRALELDPLSVEARAYLGLLYLSAGQPEEVVQQANGALELEPGYVLGHQVLGQGYCSAGRLDEAVASFDRAIALSPADADLLSLRASCYAASGRPEKARRDLRELQERAGSGFVSPVSFARVHASLGEVDAAFAWLESAYEVRWAQLPLVLFDPDFASLRPDPRFSDLLLRIGLPPLG